jgi:uncharacterized membrane protein YdjX (TVP38/TMEM64 family)
MNTSASRWKWLVWLAGIIALIAAAKYFHVATLLKGTLDWVGTLGLWGPVLFILIYGAACVLLIPGSVLTLGAGALFGVVRGSIYVSIASLVGATAAFLVGRYLARDWVAKKVAGNPKFNAIDEAVARDGWKIVGLTRLSPVFPFVLLNYAFGLTRVSLRDYVLASWIGMMPGTVMYVYLGSLAQVGAGQNTPLKWLIQGLGLVAAVLVTLYVTRIARKALAKRTGAPFLERESEP